jgi:hypothetical protein
MYAREPLSRDLLCIGASDLKHVDAGSQNKTRTEKHVPCVADLVRGGLSVRDDTCGLSFLDLVFLSVRACVSPHVCSLLVVDRIITRQDKTMGVPCLSLNIKVPSKQISWRRRMSRKIERRRSRICSEEEGDKGCFDAMLGPPWLAKVRPNCNFPPLFEPICGRNSTQNSCVP